MKGVHNNDSVPDIREDCCLIHNSYGYCKNCHIIRLDAEVLILRKGLETIKREYRNWSKEDAPKQLRNIARGYLQEADVVKEAKGLSNERSE